MKYTFFALIIASVVPAIWLSNIYAIISSVIFSALFIYVITYDYIIKQKQDTLKLVKELESKIEKHSTTLSNIEYKLGLRK